MPAKRSLRHKKKLLAKTCSKACEAVDLLLTRVAEERLLNRPQMESVRRVLLEDAAKFYQELVKQEGTNREVRHGAGQGLRSPCVRAVPVAGNRASPRRRIGRRSRSWRNSRRKIRANRSYRFDLSMAYWQLGTCR